MKPAAEKRELKRSYKDAEKVKILESKETTIVPQKRPYKRKVNSSYVKKVQGRSEQIRDIIGERIKA